MTPYPLREDRLLLEYARRTGHEREARLTLAQLHLEWAVDSFCWALCELHKWPDGPWWIPIGGFLRDAETSVDAGLVYVEQAHA